MTTKLTMDLLQKLDEPLSAYFLRRQAREEGTTEQALLDGLRDRLRIMRECVEAGLRDDSASVTGMVGGNARKVMSAPDPLRSPLLRRVAAYAMAVNEENARMHRIVAAPTAGSAGIVPAVLLGVADHLDRTDDELVLPLVTAGGIGLVLSRHSTLSGAAGGCGAEIGSSCCMAAGALAEFLGGSPEAVVHAATLALKNVIGLACDPVGGYVEVPCVKRNAFYAVHALSAANLALSGVRSVIPPDEVAAAMASVGRMMPIQLKETAEGGLAQTPTGRAIAARTRALGRNGD